MPTRVRADDQRPQKGTPPAAEVANKLYQPYIRQRSVLTLFNASQLPTWELQVGSSIRQE
jgi:hypothetical protein